MRTMTIGIVLFLGPDLIASCMLKVGDRLQYISLVEQYEGLWLTGVPPTPMFVIPASAGMLSHWNQFHVLLADIAD